MCRFIKDINGCTSVNDHVNWGVVGVNRNCRYFWRWLKACVNPLSLILLESAASTICISLWCEGFMQCFWFGWKWKFRAANFCKMILFSTVVALLSFCWTWAGDVQPTQTIISTWVEKLINFCVLAMKHWFRWLFVRDSVYIFWQQGFLHSTGLNFTDF